MNGSKRAAEEARIVARMIEERGKTHGDAITQHEVLARLWQSYLDSRKGPLTAADAMYMLLLMKISRVENSGLQKQHLEDIAGYAALTLAALNKPVYGKTAERPAPSELDSRTWYWEDETQTYEPVAKPRPPEREGGDWVRSGDMYPEANIWNRDCWSPSTGLITYRGMWLTPDGRKPADLWWWYPTKENDNA